MWNEIVDNQDIENFMNHICYFHDSCIKELKYLSGAYVDEDLSMYPVNDRRIVRIVIQRQFKDCSTIEMEFSGLKYLKLFPQDDNYTCEILDSTMILKHNCIYWCNCGGLVEKDLDNYKGTIICASKLRWRSIDNFLGEKEFYLSSI